MQVSAISVKDNFGYTMSNSLPLYNVRNNEPSGDTSFNSLTPYVSKKAVSSDRMPIVFDSINQWKNFCHHRILGGKLNIIA